MADVFDELADRLENRAERAVGRVAPRHERFRITRLRPLTFEDMTGDVSFRDDDDDVEVHGSVLSAIAEDELAVGDVVDGREDADGWTITGAIQEGEPAPVKAAMKADISSLKGRATTLEGRATTVEGRATSLESRATALEVPTIFTALPGSGNFTGRRIIYQTAAMKALGLAYGLMWDGPATYPWLVLEGRPLLDDVAAADTTTSAVYGALAGGSAGPTLTLPLAGEWDVVIGAEMESSIAGFGPRMSYKIGATAADDADHVVSSAGIANAPQAVARPRRKTIVAAATVLLAQYRVGGGATAIARNRWMHAMPVRVG